jgi:uncharacterized protein (DUF1697 family)
MSTYLSFLRGVNMTGHNKINMTDLASLYKDMGFTDAETYIQSGNVIFGCNIEAHVSDIASSVEKAILERFGYKIPVMIRTFVDLRKIISFNPYLSEEKFDPSKMAVIFLHDNLMESQIQKVADVNYPPDKFKIIGNEIYTFCPDGFGKTRLYTNFFENRMKVTGTARNWKTIMTIYKIAEDRKYFG